MLPHVLGRESRPTCADVLSQHRPVHIPEICVREQMARVTFRLSTHRRAGGHRSPIEWDSAEFSGCPRTLQSSEFCEGSRAAGLLLVHFIFLPPKSDEEGRQTAQDKLDTA